MTNKPSQATFQPEPAQEMERIREIIFGAQMREYEGRFQSIQRDLERIREITIGAPMREYEGRFQSIQRDLEWLRQEIDRLTEQLAEQDSSQSRKVQDLRREMRQADDDLREELRETAQRLTVEKVDRIALGELFIELGTYLKMGTPLAEFLEKLEKRVETTW